MNLKQLVSLAALTYMLVIGASLFGHRLLVVLPQLKQAELELHRNDLKAIFTTYINEREPLILHNRGLAKWDDTYGFIATRDPHYVERTFENHEFSDHDVDYILILDSKGQIRYQAQWQDHQMKAIKSKQTLLEHLNPQPLLQQDGHYQLISINGELGYLTSHTIQDSELEFAANGVLIFIRLFKQDFYRRIKLLTNSDFSFHSNLPQQPDAIWQDGNLKLMNTLKSHYQISVLDHHQQTIASASLYYPPHTLPSAIDSTALFSIFLLLLLPVIITLIIFHFFLRPISKIFSHIQHMDQQGKLTHLNVRNPIAEIDFFAKSFDSLVDQIHEYEAKMEMESNTDGLTNLNNRRYFDNRYDQIWRESTRNHLPLCIFMLDIDYFKKYNDHYGHQQGDVALKQVAQTFQQNCRRAGDLLARYGGEEFVLVRLGGQKEDIKQFSQHLVKAVQQLSLPHEKSEVAPTLTISCGACIIEEAGLWMKHYKESALKVADEALYTAKAKGRNQAYIRIFEPID